MAEPKKEDKKKKMGTTKLILIMLAIGLVSLGWGALSRHKNSPEAANASVPTTTTRQVVTVTVTDAPHEIEIPFGMNINFKLRTKDVVWWVQPGDGKVFERPPINSPKFKDIDYGNKFESIKVWVAPGTTAELAYYFTPA